MQPKPFGDGRDTRSRYGAVVTARSTEIADGRRLPVRFNPKQGLRIDGGRVTVVYSAAAGRPTVVDQLHSSLPHVNAVALGRSTLADLLVLAPDVVVVDHDDTSFDLVRVCRDLREALRAWIIVLSGDNSEDHEASWIAALEAGADSFLPRAASSRLVAACVMVGLRTRLTGALKRSRLTIGDVVIDLDAHALYIAEERVDCRPVQFQLLVALASKVNEVSDRDGLLASVWGAQPDSIDSRRLRIAISHLRQVLGTGASRPHIETVAHVGYRLVFDGADEDDLGNEVSAATGP